MKRPRGSAARLWTFRLASAVLAPILLLGALEIALRVVGYGNDPRFAIPCTIGGRAAFCDNPAFTQRFFPAEIARTAPSFAFEAVKPPGTIRVFVIGGSAAQGDPEPTFGPARMLRALMESRYPGVNLEIVNAGITAVNSHVVRLVARDLAGHDPDLFVAYLGHNEVVGPYGPSNVFSPTSGSLTLIRAKIFLRGTRLGQLVARLAGTSDAQDSPEWRGMEFFLDRRVPHDDPRLEDVYSHFEANLEAIASAAGAPLILSTVGTNLKDFAPLASDAAETEYRQGRELLAAGDLEKARVRLELARDLDTLRFRADRRINEIVRAVAGRSPDVRLVDAEGVLAEAGESGVPGNDLFLDHVHLSFHGTYVLAEAILQEMEDLLPNRATAGSASHATEEACAARLAYTDFDRHRVATLMLARIARPPFPNRFDHDAHVANLQTEIDELASRAGGAGLRSALATYESAIALAPHDAWLRFNHASLLATAGNHLRAGEELLEFLDRLPHDIQGRERWAAALAEQGRFEEAVAACRGTLERAPRLSPSYYTMAYAQANLGRLDEALDTYRHLLEVDAGAWDRVYNEMGRIEIHRERFDAAIHIFEEGVRRAERSPEVRIPDLHYNHGFALKRAGRAEEAMQALRRAAEDYVREIETDPDSAALHLALGSTLVEGGELGRASDHFREAVRLEPTNPSAHYNLVRSLEALDRRDEAAAAALAGIRALTNAGLRAEADQLGGMLGIGTAPRSDR